MEIRRSKQTVIKQELFEKKKNVDLVISDIKMLLFNSQLSGLKYQPVLKCTNRDSYLKKNTVFRNNFIIFDKKK